MSLRSPDLFSRLFSFVRTRRIVFLYVSTCMYPTDSRKYLSFDRPCPCLFSGHCVVSVPVRACRLSALTPIFVLCYEYSLFARPCRHLIFLVRMCMPFFPTLHRSLPPVCHCSGPEHVYPAFILPCTVCAIYPSLRCHFYSALVYHCCLFAAGSVICPRPYLFVCSSTYIYPVI